MLCKVCGGLVERQYEASGICEDCSADIWGNVTDIYRKNPQPEAEYMYEENILELPVSELNLSTRTVNRLSILNINYIRDLVKHSETELMKVPYLGEASLKEITKGLEIFGLTLKQVPFLQKQD